jgi:phosphonate degradation associated HDIG domain protein
MAHAEREAVIERIVTLYETRGRRAYDESVDQVAHAVQAAGLAERAGAAPPLIVAALLHDVGHLLENQAGPREHDAFHERLGARFLTTWFPPAVVAPVALHVAAKRYLVATDPGYAGLLSPASVRSLALQGGPMSRADVERFEGSPHADAAVRLRRWDEGAKIAGLAVPPLASFTALIRGVMHERAGQGLDAGLNPGMFSGT